MLSKTAEYALRAVATIARVKEDRPVLAKEIAGQGKIPNKYLSKVMRDLVHAGVLTSTRGIGGGFRLKRKADGIKLADVIRPFDDVMASQRCPFGNERCDDDQPCSMHEKWRPVSEAVQHLFERTTIADIVRGTAPIRFDTHKGRSNATKRRARAKG